MKRLPPDDCGFAAALNAVGGKWKMTILWEVHAGPRRFGELRRLLPGISEKVLTEQLRQMEADGLVARRVYPEVVQRVEYSVTAVGLSLQSAINVMSDWGKEHAARLAETGTRRKPT
ncbi:winged helix-turn-helix transcriptional regulator [Sphingosinicella terrae]|uniref:winged helix-turn-helix transcriptional regulator n=1 Tax=Sphingosinicella terrae TaxID=2172047 RepID=UPI000E0D838E|nr:helix-turn-helix domain-containing protein [Sphingosinicella terrae]